jgi:hypothetical protein
MSKKLTVSEWENKIYDYYYEQNPDGDARYSLWPDVIEAKKMSNPEEALEDLYNRMVDGVTLY